MKIKDLPGDPSLGMTRFIYPGDGKPYYWFSQWQKGVWGKEAANSSQLIPLFVDDLAETLEWEVVEEDSPFPNNE